MKVAEVDLIVNGGRKTNERRFVVMEEMEDETLSYEKGEAEETTHSVCTRQLMDDANRLKCRKTQQKK